MALKASWWSGGMSENESDEVPELDACHSATVGAGVGSAIREEAVFYIISFVGQLVTNSLNLRMINRVKCALLTK